MYLEGERNQEVTERRNLSVWGSCRKSVLYFPHCPVLCSEQQAESHLLGQTWAAHQVVSLWGNEQLCRTPAIFLHSVVFGSHHPARKMSDCSKTKALTGLPHSGNRSGVSCSRERRCSGACSHICKQLWSPKYIPPTYSLLSWSPLGSLPQLFLAPKCLYLSGHSLTHFLDHSDP